MALDDTLALPFFDDDHRRFAEALARWADAKLPSLPHDDVDAACRARVKALGEAGIPQGGGAGIARRAASGARRAHALPRPRNPGVPRRARRLRLRHAGARHRLDLAVRLRGIEARYLPPVRDGKAIAAFALSEPEAGSDVAALAMTAKADGAHVRLDGEKTWISNGGIADHYVVFARTGEAPGARGLSAFVVDADTPGLTVAERIEVIAPHPLARLTFDGVRVPVANRLGKPGEGFKVAMATLDIFRATVGAAALGFARRALHETVEHAATRKLFGAPLGDLQMTQAAIADSATEVDAAALLVYRAAWMKDQGAARVTREAAMAKMFATEAAQRVIDRAVQLHGGAGVTQGRQGRGALPGNPRAAHLRGRDRSAEDRDCA